MYHYKKSTWKANNSIPWQLTTIVTLLSIYVSSKNKDLHCFLAITTTQNAVFIWCYMKRSILFRFQNPRLLLGGWLLFEEMLLGKRTAYRHVHCIKLQRCLFCFLMALALLSSMLLLLTFEISVLCCWFFQILPIYRIQGFKVRTSTASSLARTGR